LPLDDVHAARTAVIDHEDRGAARKGPVRPGDKTFGPAADLDLDLAGTLIAAGGDREHADRADRGFIARQ
jgi:hypothetical protein